MESEIVNKEVSIINATEVNKLNNKQTCDNCGQDHKYCEPTNKEQFGFCGNWAEHQ